MNLSGSLRFALRGISANKLRSMLTTLGILIGVAAVIILLSVGTGSSAAVKKSISRLGTETLTVNRSAGGNGRAGAAAGGAGGLGGGGFAGARARLPVARVDWAAADSRPRAAAVVAQPAAAAPAANQPRSRSRTQPHFSH